MASGQGEEFLREETDAWFEERVVPHITDSAVLRIEQHRSSGHHLVVLSAASVYVVRPLAERLKIPDYLCTYLEVESGRFTGNLLGPAAFGPGKALLAQHFAAERGIDLRQSTFYSDGHEDIPMLELVGNPVAVNPDRKLKQVARQRGWPIEMWY
jgi:putative phosphoserine phosphatase/1-acylglycerol-3-phosphate O-acyltransferase